jgi:hypothetical protein
MKALTKIFFSLVSISLFLVSCQRTDDNSNQYDISYYPVNKEYVLIRDIQLLKESDDEISNHVDSILSGLINEEFISTGQKNFDLDADLTADIAFEIIDLNKYNPNGLPESFDSLAARVLPISTEILDNSTYGYPDALELDDLISGEGKWSDRTSVLGTFLDAGQFKGKGNKYLGIRFLNPEGHNYGWIRLYCSQHNDTLRIIDYAYNNISGCKIYAGQTE